MDIQTLAKIDRLRLQFDKCGDTQALQTALDLITTKTVNVEWYRSVITKLEECGAGVEDRNWIVETIDKYNSKAWAYRDLFHKASETLDGSKIAEAAIAEGIWHVQGGDFRLAKQAFETAKRTDPTQFLECIYYSMTVDLLRREYSTAASTFSKQYKSISELKEPIVGDLLYTYALALWKSRHLADCAVVLLSITDYTVDPAKWPWASESNIAIMCIVGSLLTLSNENLFFLVNSDMKVAAFFKQWPYLRELVLAYMNVDIAQFDLLWIKLETEIDAYLVKGLRIAHTQLRDALLGTYLAVRTECPLSSVLKLFRVSDPVQLAVLALEKNLPIEVDPIQQTVKTVMPQPAVGIEREYIQGSVATIWHNGYGPLINSEGPSVSSSGPSGRHLRGHGHRQWGATARPPIRPVPDL